MQASPDRRRFLRLVAAGAASLPLLRFAPAQAADTPHLTVDDPTAKALGYVESASKIDASKETAFKAGSDCGNCMFFQAAQASGDYAPCQLFPGKAVNKNGWCRSYAKKT